MTSLSCVTGAFGYTGRFIAEELLSRGESVITITGHPERESTFGDRIPAFPFNFDDPDKLVETLRGVKTLYNTYWIRFNYGEMTFDRAVANTKAMIDAAVQAGVERIVHVSITNPASDSRLPYFRGKAELEDYIKAADLTHAILRPTVIFSEHDILLNNIAHLLRRFPFFVVPGDGEYSLQPIYVRDLAKLAVDHGEGSSNITLDAIGPETFTFNEIVELIRERIGSRSIVWHWPPGLALAASRLVGLLVSDVVLTRDEVLGLAENRLLTHSPLAGTTPFSTWAAANVHRLGAKYASELNRHYR